MGFLKDNCIFSVFDENVLLNVAAFHCGDDDLDDFFQNEAIAYSHQLLGKSYCFQLEKHPEVIVCAFTVANASMRVDHLPNARKKKIIKNIPHIKEHKSYPAVLVGRLGVNMDYQSNHIGHELMNFIKSWFVDPLNKTGCRFIVVDAYNNEKTISYYRQNNFDLVFTTEQQECMALGLLEEVLHTRFMYFDLITIC